MVWPGSGVTPHRDRWEEGVGVVTTQCMKIQSLLKAVERMASSNPALSLVPLTQGEEFLYHATEVKNIWLPMGEIFAN